MKKYVQRQNWARTGNTTNSETLEYSSQYRVSQLKQEYIFTTADFNTKNNKKITNSEANLESNN